MRYDVVTIGGGLAGAAMAKALAQEGLRVLVLEREQTFRDRVRGEQMHPWGVAETRALGLYGLLKDSCGFEVRTWSTRFLGADENPPRDLVESSPHRAGSLNFYHPSMQAVLLDAAVEAGATVWRGVTAVEVLPGEVPLVRARDAEGERVCGARLVVGADGRNSACRNWAGFRVEHDPDRMALAGVLLKEVSAPQDRVSLSINSSGGVFSLTVPLGANRFRVYLGTFKQDGFRPHSGRHALPDLLAASIAAGAPAAWWEDARAVGPLASFDGADSWVEHPYRDGVALIGDAAASSDPCFGCGLSLALRDVRVLRDALLAENDWDAAGHAYAAEHDRQYGAIHRHTDWKRTVFFDPRPEAAAIRARALPRIAQDPTRVPDTIGVGPDAPSDEAARRRFFGED
jgi:menaquinone-9 beta-reductase